MECILLKNGLVCLPSLYQLQEENDWRTQNFASLFISFIISYNQTTLLRADQTMRGMWLPVHFKTQDNLHSMDNTVYGSWQVATHQAGKS